MKTIGVLFFLLFSVGCVDAETIKACAEACEGRSMEVTEQYCECGCADG